MGSTQGDWPLLSRLLDEGLALSEPARAGWLAALDDDAAALRPRLARLLAHARDAERDDFLDQPASFTAPARRLGATDTAGTPDGEHEWHHVAGQVLGPWTLERPLGRGGMAEVWLARRSDGVLERSVALKLPYPDVAQGRLTGRFVRERHLLAALTHPNIVRLFDAGSTAEGRPWLAMEAVDGVSITAWCERHEASLAQRLALLRQTCDAVQHAHGRLVVHRDIKPSNILVTPDGELRLLDFGIAKLLQADVEGAAETSITHWSGRPLTPDFASPEQVNGEEPGVATDVYALGVLAYVMLAGVSPYEPVDRSRRALEAAIAEQAPRPPSARCAGRRAWQRALRGDLDTIVLKALKKDPAERYATAEAFAADLRRHLAGEVVLARPDTLAYRTSRLLSRHRWAAAAVLAVVLAIGAGGAAALLQARQARAEAARSQAMYDFLHGLFNRDDSPAADIANRDMTVKDLLAGAAQRIAGSLPDSPAARFRLMRDLANFSLSAGSREQAIGLLEANLAQASALYGADSVEAAYPLLSLAELRHEARGDFAGALALASAVRRIYERRGVTDALAVGNAESLVGFYGMRVHALPEPQDIELLEHAARLLRPLGNGTRARASGLGTALEVLAIAYGETGQPDKALATAQEGVAFTRRVYGQVNWKTAAQLEQAAIWSRVLNRRADAERLLREARSIYESVWPADHFQRARWSKYFAELLAPGDRRREGRDALDAGYALIRQPKWTSNVIVRQAIEDQLLDLDWRSGAVDAAAARCDAMRAEWPRKNRGSRLVDTQRCAAVAVARGDFTAARALIDEGRREAIGRCPKGDCVGWFDLRAAELSAAEGHLPDAAAAFVAVLDVSDAHDLLLRAQAWLGLAGLDASHPRLRPGAGLAQAQAGVQALDAGTATEMQALLAEAAGRVALARGDRQAALSALGDAVRLRERIDDAMGVWLARSRLALAEALAVDGDSAGAAAERDRARRAIAAAGPLATRMLGGPQTTAAAAAAAPR